jgi:uncharacterized protein (DUF58 family)
MKPQNSSPLPGSSYPSLAPVLIGSSGKVEIEQAARLSLAMTLYLLNTAARIDLPLVNKTVPTPIAPRTLRANLHAAARHVALGHEAPTFRDCSSFMCLDAANLVPSPIAVEPEATDAELDAIFQRAILAVFSLSRPSSVPLGELRPFRDKFHEN